MTFPLLRRLAVLGVTGLITVQVLVLVFSSIASLARQSSALGEADAALAEVQTRHADAIARLATQQDPGARGALEVGSAGDAARALNARIQQTATQAGQLLTLNTQGGENGIVEARLLWRGSETDLRTVMERLGAVLPDMRWTAFTVRRVDLGGESRVELNASLQQAWREVPQ